MEVTIHHHGDVKFEASARGHRVICDQPEDNGGSEKAKLPARLGQFRIEVTIPGLDPEHQAGVLRAVKACLIHNTLLHAPAIETMVSTPALAHAV